MWMRSLSIPVITVPVTKRAISVTGREHVQHDHRLTSPVGQRARFHHAAQNCELFKTWELLISGTFHLIFLDHGCPHGGRNQGTGNRWRHHCNHNCGSTRLSFGALVTSALVLSHFQSIGQTSLWAYFSASLYAAHLWLVDRHCGLYLIWFWLLLYSYVLEFCSGAWLKYLKMVWLSKVLLLRIAMWDQSNV